MTNDLIFIETMKKSKFECTWHLAIKPFVVQTFEGWKKLHCKSIYYVYLSSTLIYNKKLARLSGMLGLHCKTSVFYMGRRRGV